MNKTFSEGLKKNEEAEELMKKTEVDESPFMIISLTESNEHFGVLGKYRLTEKFDSIEEAMNETKNMSWNRITQVIALVANELLENKDKVDELIKKEKV